MMDVKCKELRCRAWDRLHGHYWRSVGASVLGRIIGSVGIVFTAGPMEAGINGYYLKQQREQDDNELGQIFCGFDRYGSSLGGYLLRALYIILWNLIPIVGQVIGGCIKPFAYSQMYFVMLDFELGANDAITRSKELMRGFKWKLFKLRLSFIGWYLLCVVSLGIGYIFLRPYFDAAEAEFYAELLHCHDEIIKEDELSAADDGNNVEANVEPTPASEEPATEIPANEAQVEQSPASEVEQTPPDKPE